MTNDGQYAYVTNFGDCTVSCYEIAGDGSLELQIRWPLDPAG